MSTERPTWWSNWLFGPRLVESPSLHYLVYLRSVEIDPETVGDLVRHSETRLGQYFPDMTFQHDFWLESGVQVSAEEVRGLSAVDRGRLSLIIRAGNTPPESKPVDVTIEFHAGKQPKIMSPYQGEQPVERTIRIELANYLLEHGRPIVQWPRVIASLPIVLALLAIAAYIWSLTTSIPLALILLNTAFLLTTTTYAIYAHMQLTTWSQKRWTGHRIRAESRAETVARLAERNERLRVGIITGFAGVVLGSVGTLITSRLIG